ncbi:phage tail fiber protein, partial [bacterium]|nr:phage tail fiber protein [bacterium]
MACTDVQTIQAGNGSKTQFSFDFPYIFKSEIHVYFWNVTTKEYDEVLTTDATYPWQVTDANPTIVEFTSTAPPSPAAPTDPGEPTVDNVKIRRITQLDDISALFNPGSAIRSDDLNKNFEQLRYAIQEANCPGIPDDVDAYLKEYYWDRFDNTLYSADAWRSDDATIATTASLDQRFQDEVNDTFTKAELATASQVMPDDDVAVPTTGALNDYINEVITNDIGTDGTGITVTDDGDGTITLGLADNTIDFSKVKDADIITYAEQDAGSPAPADTNIFTASAAARRFDTLVQSGTPAGSDWETGKTWLQNDTELTLSVWNGSTWSGVASGGTFTNQPKVVYVDASSGSDTNDGHRISRPKLTIKAAVQQINADATYGDGSVVVVAPGVYQEAAPIDI